MFAISSNIPKILIVTELRGFISYSEKGKGIKISPSSRKVASKSENRHE